jgi:2'-5' RNA ligase
MPKPSFVEVVLPEDMRDVLHGLAMQTVGNFTPMDSGKLHCTVLFCGNELISGPPERSRRALHAMHAACADAPQRVRVHTLALFPPGKQNLLVALLEVPAEWHRRRAELMAELPVCSNESEWVPHVTLGKFGPRAQTDAAVGRLNVALEFDMVFRLRMSGPELRGSRAMPTSS